MLQISKQEFEWLPLRVHDFLAGVPLHDVWAIDLPRARSGITLDEFLKTTNSRCLRPSRLSQLTCPTTGFTLRKDWARTTGSTPER